MNQHCVRLLPRGPRAHTREVLEECGGVQAATE